MANIKIEALIGKSFWKQVVDAEKLNSFKCAFTALYKNISAGKSENQQKGYFGDFLKSVLNNEYMVSEDYQRIDLVLHEGVDAVSPISVIFEIKRMENINEMVSEENLNVKSLQELLLYYLRQRTAGQTHMQYLVALDFNDLFIFPVDTFEKNFYNNKSLIKEFKKYDEEQMPSISTTSGFYEEIASKYIASSNLSYCHIPLRDYYEKYINDDSKMSELYKIFSAETLLKKTVVNDSNILNRKFYNELLYILGLEEKKENGKIVLLRSKKQPASLIEKTITVLKDNDRNIRSNSKFGETYEDRIYNAALELSILWLNRILFLKLLETQLYKYNNKDDNYKFLNNDKVKYFDDFNTLFFSVFGKDYADRDSNVKKNYGHLPYLNSSLFEKCQLEWDTITMANLKDNDGLVLPIYKSSVLPKEPKQLPLIQYLLSFLNAFDFSSDKDTVTSSGDKLINASVLGLIFEKINGYKDGAIFTPGYITQYISRFTIEKCVVDKFNKKYGWSCSSLTEVYNSIWNKNISIKEANDIINNLKILDPAVGSGHFLVSALNELIYIKYQLGILVDDSGKTINRGEYDIDIINDELVIKSGDKFFSYNKDNTESKRLQKTIFNEKKWIIENCLFGVDINPNAVNICRLRLWIELLKNSYYKDNGQLETLPNIDINIKCGNSLVHRFDLDIDLSDLKDKNIRDIVVNYKTNVKKYKGTNDKNTKYEIEESIKAIKDSFKVELKNNSKEAREYDKNIKELGKLQTQTNMFPLTAAELKREKELLAAIENYENKYKNKAYNNALEWRFEFPEVLDQDGNFEGFDCVIGNPPYIQLQKLHDNTDGSAELYRDNKYEVFEAEGDIYCLFYECGINLLKDDAILAYITSNKWMKADYGKKLRQYFSKWNVIELIDLGGEVFENATVDTNILFIQKNENNTVPALCYDYNKGRYSNLDDNIPFVSIDFPKDGSTWLIESDIKRKIKKKVVSQGKQIKDRNDIQILFGVKTGYNDAFMINKLKRDEILTNCKTEDERKRTEELLRPVLRGRDVKHYSIEYKDLYLITTHNGIKKLNKERIKIEDYPAIKKHLDNYYYNLEKRKDKGNTIYNLRNCAYLDEFNKEKIIYPEMNYNRLNNFYLDNQNYIGEATLFILTGKHLGYLTAFLNSNLFDYYFKDSVITLGLVKRAKKTYIETIYIKDVSDQDDERFKELVYEIQNKKKNKEDTTELEEKINNMIYELYGLTEDEIKEVEKEVKNSK